MRITPTGELARMLAKRPELLAGFDVDADALAHFRRDVNNHHPDADEETREALAVYTTLFHPTFAPCAQVERTEAQSAPLASAEPEPTQACEPVATPTVVFIERDRSARIVRWIQIGILLAILLALLAPRAHAQSKDTLVIQLQSGGTTLGTAGGILKLNCSTATYSNHVWTCSAAAAGAAWGSITGTLSSQTDLSTALAAKEATIAAGTTGQYWRGDKSWQSLASAIWAQLSGTAPISFNASTGGFSCLTATGSVDGCLSAAEWTAFNSKQPLIGNCLQTTYTASGTIPQYALVVLSGAFVQVTGTGGGPSFGVAQTAVTNGQSVGVCSTGYSFVLMDGTAASGSVAQPSTTVGGQAHDGAITSRNNIGQQVGAIGGIITGCTGAGCAAVVALDGPNRAGRQILGSYVPTLNQNTTGTAAALGANGSNCSAGQYPLGVDASANSESCTPETLTLFSWAANMSVGLAFGTPQNAWGIGFTGTPSRAVGIVPATGTFKNLYVSINSAQATNTQTCTLQTASPGGTLTDTALTVTIANAATAGTYSDTTHSVNVTAGDWATLRCVQNVSGSGGILSGLALSLLHQ